MDGKSRNLISNRSCSSSISYNSNDSRSSLIVNEPLVKPSPTKRRCVRPPKKQDNEIKEEKRTILSWLINFNIVQENAAVCYVQRNAHQPLKFGRIVRVGILCYCCFRILTAEDFQAHAIGKVYRPYEHVILMDVNRSLLYCMNIAWNHPHEVARRKFNLIEGVGRYSDTYDDACMICADGGELICCDQCNSTYHHRCMNMEVVPENSWHCPYCVCKLCGNVADENDYLITCSQCEKKYHWDCYRDRELIQIDINSTPSAPFCEQGCREIYIKLEKMVGVSNMLDDGHTWTLLRRMDEDDSANAVHDVYKRIECHSKLAIAWSVMKDCFEPITDRHTRIDVIQSIVYSCGSNYNRINFRGFYTAILEKDGEIISAASLRIHGNRLAEMPFIATNAIYRRNGMCRELMSAIESALHFLKIGYLIIPSVLEKEGNWSDGYNFSHLNAEMKKQIMCFNTLMFHDSVRLQKALLPSNLGRGGAKNIDGSQTVKLSIDLNQEMTENNGRH